MHRWENDDRWAWPSESAPQRVTVRPSKVTGDGATEGSSKRRGQTAWAPSWGLWAAARLTSESERDCERSMHFLVRSFWVKKMSRAYLG